MTIILNFLLRRCLSSRKFKVTGGQITEEQFDAAGINTEIREE
jgi:hypothetical protein